MGSLGMLGGTPVSQGWYWHQDGNRVGTSRVLGQGRVAVLLTLPGGEQGPSSLQEALRSFAPLTECPLLWGGGVSPIPPRNHRISRVAKDPQEIIESILTLHRITQNCHWCGL